jgi:hypothetical protein
MPAPELPPAARPPSPAEPVSRAWLYMLAVVLVGLLVVPVAWKHPHIKRWEKIFIITLGLLHDLAVVAIAVLFFFWFLAYLRARMQAGR